MLSDVLSKVKDISLPDSDYCGALSDKQSKMSGEDETAFV